MNPQRILTRRAFLKGTGLATVLVAGGAVWRAVDQGVFSVGQGPAYEPWKNWRDAPGDGPLALVRAAILAANPHNSQPWLFHVQANSIDVFADTDRNLGAIDPFLREMYTGLGCALENLVLAAKANGYDPEVSLMPAPTDETHVAHIQLTSGTTEVSDLYQAIPNRHTNRAAYDTTRPIEPMTIAAFNALKTDETTNLFWFTSPAERQRVSEPIVAATEALNADVEQSTDSLQWFRSTWREVQTLRSGLTFETQGQSDLNLAFLKLLPEAPREVVDSFFLQFTRDIHVATAAGFGLIAVRDHRDNVQRLQGGQLWQRLHLWATTQGIAMHPLSQMPERADREVQLGLEPTFGKILAELIGDETWQALLLFRLGYPTATARLSPRRAVESVLI